MKKLISLALMLVVLLCAKPTVYAMEGTEPIEENTLSVKTLGELQSAIASAEDGDEIQVLKSIVFESGEYCCKSKEHSAGRHCRYRCLCKI